MAAAGAAVVLAVLGVGAAMSATARAPIDRRIRILLGDTVRDEVTEQMQPIVKKVDKIQTTQERNEEKWDQRLRAIEANGSKMLGVLEVLRARQ
jgi:hypothetical protein